MGEDLGHGSYDRSWPVAGNPLPSSSISQSIDASDTVLLCMGLFSIFCGMTPVTATTCGVAAANIYYNQPSLGVMEAAFRGLVAVIRLLPTANLVGFAAGLLLLVPLGDRFDRRRLILIQLAALTLSSAAATLAADAWSIAVGTCRRDIKRGAADRDFWVCAVRRPSIAQVPLGAYRCKCFPARPHRSVL